MTVLQAELSASVDCNITGAAMKVFAALALVTILVYALFVSSACAYEPSVGVKQGDWIEYSISMKGPPLDSSRNLTWYRIDILEVSGGWIEVNKTALSVDGIFSSSIWDFNLTEGHVLGWVIIPANLGVGDAFFDAAKSANVTIEGEEQKTLFGSSRTVTHASDPGSVYKEWDKATGIYVNAVEHTTDYTVITGVIATNMWSTQILGQNQGELYRLVVVIIAVALVTLFFSLFIVRRKSFTTRNL